MASSIAASPPPLADAAGASAAAPPAVTVARGTAHGRPRRRPEAGGSSPDARLPLQQDAPGPQGQPAAGLHGRMRRNLLLLACCQAVGQAGNTMMFAATALSVVTFYPQRDLATLPVTMQHLGVMLWVFPASMLMQRMGRRFGFRVGSVFGMAGGGIGRSEGGRGGEE